MNKTYWLVTDKAEVPYTHECAKTAHENALKDAHTLYCFGVKSTILCDGNIVWVSPVP